MHVQPLHGQPQPVGDAIVELMFPDGETRRIPIIGTASTPAAPEIGCLIAGLLRQFGRRVGIAVGNDVQIDGQQPFHRIDSDQERINSLLLHPHVEAAIFDSHMEEALASGLGCECCDVAVLTSESITSDRRQDETLPPEVLPLIHAVSPEGFFVLPADAPQLDRVLANCRGQTVLYSSVGETAPICKHQAEGRRVAFLLNDSLVLGRPQRLFSAFHKIRSFNIHFPRTLAPRRGRCLLRRHSRRTAVRHHDSTLLVHSGARRIQGNDECR
jgi:cyanophycin synthetase